MIDEILEALEVKHKNKIDEINKKYEKEASALRQQREHRWEENYNAKMESLHKNWNGELYDCTVEYQREREDLQSNL